MIRDQLAHIHIIGICGVATGAMAIAFKNAGYKVTGSDKGFFPPISTALKEAGVDFYAGWHPEKMVENGIPDLVVITTFSGSKNPETQYVWEKNIPHASYVEVFRDYFIKDNSIVVAGTWGKTTTTAILSYILLRSGLDPSYMFGAVSLSHKAAASIGSGGWSVFEGDEYKSSPTDPSPKFAYYKPTHLLLTALSWDHADLYPTEESYFEAFKKLISNIPENGLVVAKSGLPDIGVRPNCKTLCYGNLEGSNYQYKNVICRQNGLSFEILNEGKTYEIKSPMLGKYNAENITGAFAMAHQIGIAAEKIVEAISEFRGLKRRLERRCANLRTDTNLPISTNHPSALSGTSPQRGEVGTFTVIDDIAHSPEKARSALREIREIYPNAKIFAVFEPNIGGRRKEAAGKYGGAFKDADEVIIPRLTKLKNTKLQTPNYKQTTNSKLQITNQQEESLEGRELTEVIGKTHPNARCIEEDGELVRYVKGSAKSGDVVVFLGSHGFRGMIEEVCR